MGSEPRIGNRFGFAFRMRSDQFHRIDEVSLVQTCEAYNKKTDSALLMNFFKMPDLMFLNKVFRKAGTILCLLCFEIDVAPFVQAVVVGRRRCPVIGFDNLRLAPSWIVNPDDLDRCWLLIDQSPVSFSVIQVGVVDVFFKTDAAVRMVVTHAPRALHDSFCRIVDCAHRLNYIEKATGIQRIGKFPTDRQNMLFYF